MKTVFFFDASNIENDTEHAFVSLTNLDSLMMFTASNGVQVTQ